jgi:hypothetical protein
VARIDRCSKAAGPIASELVLSVVPFIAVLHEGAATKLAKAG